jgi:hypothetical protein
MAGGVIAGCVFNATRRPRSTDATDAARLTTLR